MRRAERREVLRRFRELRRPTSTPPARAARGHLRAPELRAVRATARPRIRSCVRPAASTSARRAMSCHTNNELVPRARTVPAPRRCRARRFAGPGRRPSSTRTVDPRCLHRRDRGFRRSSRPRPPSQRGRAPRGRVVPFFRCRSPRGRPSRGTGGLLGRSVGGSSSSPSESAHGNSATGTYSSVTNEFVAATKRQTT